MRVRVMFGFYCVCWLVGGAVCVCVCVLFLSTTVAPDETVRDGVVWWRRRRRLVVFTLRVCVLHFGAVKYRFDIHGTRRRRRLCRRRRRAEWPLALQNGQAPSECVYVCACIICVCVCV